MICYMKIPNGWSTYDVSSGLYYWIMRKVNTVYQDAFHAISNRRCIHHNFGHMN